MKKWFLISNKEDEALAKVFGDRAVLVKYLKDQASSEAMDFNELRRTFMIIEGIEHGVTFELDLKEKE